MSDSSFVGHEACPACGSKDNLARYDDGHGHCFGCGHREAAPANPTTMRRNMSEFTPVSGECVPLLARNISEETCRKWNYTRGEYKGKTVQIANYMKDGRIVAQKLRFADKSFTFLGAPKEAGLYGSWLWRDGGKMVVVTEGEIDALSVSQLQGNKWPVVSVPNGAQGAKKSIQAALEWLERFETVVLMFDNDEPGRKAAEECAALFTPGKCKIAQLPLKDANALLVAGRGAEVIDALWGAKQYRPDGIVTSADLRERLRKPIESGLAWPWPELTDATYGIRTGEIYTLGAGTGMGKSEVWKEVAAHLYAQHHQKVGMLFLEETPEHTLRCLAGKLDSTLYHLPDVAFERAQFEARVEEMSGHVFLYDHFGYTDFETIRSRIRYLVVSCGCKYIVLDHITALVTGDKELDERRALDYLMTSLASLVRELDFALFLISHLSTPDGTPHEEGGRVQLKHFRGSRAIGQWSNFVFGLERNQQDEDAAQRHVSTFRILKDRYTGRATGRTFELHYDQNTGRLHSHSDAPVFEGQGEF